MQNNFNAFWNIIKYINQNIDKIFDYDTDNDYSFLLNLRDFYNQKGDRISESEAKEYFKNFIKIDKYLVYHGEVSSSIEDFVLKIKNNLDAIDKLELSNDDIEEISLVLGDIGYDVKYNIYFNESKDPESVIEFGKPILVLNISSRVEKRHIEDLVDYLSRRDLEISNQYRLRDRTQYRITYKKYINRNNQEKLFVISSAANPLTESIDNKSKIVNEINEKIDELNTYRSVYSQINNLVSILQRDQTTGKKSGKFVSGISEIFDLYENKFIHIGQKIKIVPDFELRGGDVDLRNFAGIKKFAGYDNNKNEEFLQKVLEKVNFILNIVKNTKIPYSKEEMKDILLPIIDDVESSYGKCLLDLKIYLIDGIYVYEIEYLLDSKSKPYEIDESLYSYFRNNYGLELSFKEVNPEQFHRKLLKFELKQIKNSNESKRKINKEKLSDFNIDQLKELESYIEKANKLNILKKIDNIGHIINLYHVTSIYDMDKREFTIYTKKFKSVSNGKIPRLISGLKYLIKEVENIKEPKLSSEEFKYLMQPIIDDFDLKENQYLTKVWLGVTDVFYVLETTIFSKELGLPNDIINYLENNGIELIDSKLNGSFISNQLHFKDIEDLTESMINEKEVYMDGELELINKIDELFEYKSIFPLIDNFNQYLRSFDLSFILNKTIDFIPPRNTPRYFKHCCNSVDMFLSFFKKYGKPKYNKEEFEEIIQPIIDDLDTDKYALGLYMSLERGYSYKLRVNTDRIEIRNDVNKYLEDKGIVFILNIGSPIKSISFKFEEKVNESKISKSLAKYNINRDIYDKLLSQLYDLMSEANKIEVFKYIDNMTNVLNSFGLLGIYDLKNRTFAFNTREFDMIKFPKVSRNNGVYEQESSIKNIKSMIPRLKKMIETFKDIKLPSKSKEEFEILIQPIIDDLDLNDNYHIRYSYFGYGRITYLLLTGLYDKYLEVSKDILDVLRNNDIELEDNYSSKGSLYFKDIDSLNESIGIRNTVKDSIQKNIVSIANLVVKLNKNYKKLMSSINLDYAIPSKFIAIKKIEIYDITYLIIKDEMSNIKNLEITKLFKLDKELKIVIDWLEKLESFLNKPPKFNITELEYILQPVIDDLERDGDVLGIETCVIKDIEKDIFIYEYRIKSNFKENYVIDSNTNKYLNDNGLEVYNYPKKAYDKNINTLGFREIDGLNESLDGKYKYDLINDKIEQLNEYRGLYKQFDNIVAVIQKRRFIPDIYNMNDRMFTEIPKYKEFSDETLTDTLEKLDSLLELFKSLEYPKYTKEEMMDILTPILDDLESLYPIKTKRFELKLYLIDNHYSYRLEHLIGKNDLKYEMEENIYNYLEGYGLKLKFEEFAMQPPMSRRLLRFDITEVKNINESISNKNEDLLDKEKTMSDLKEKYLEINKYRDIFPLISNLSDVLRTYEISFILNKNFDILTNKSSRQIKRLYDRVDALINFFEEYGRPKYTKEEFEEIIQPIIDDLDSDSYVCEIYMILGDGYTYIAKFEQKTYDKIEVNHDIKFFLKNYGISYHVSSGNSDSRIKSIMFKVDESNNESLVNKKSLEQLKKVKTKNISLKKFANLLSDENLLDKHIQTYEEFLKTKV